MTKSPGLINTMSKKVQSGVQGLIPEKAQNIITASIKTMVETVLSGSALITPTTEAVDPALSESDFLVEKAYNSYHSLAVAQGVGFGLGGILVNLADLPALLTIKMKFLFDCGKLYGFNVNKEEERIFMLYIFQLAFSSDKRRTEIFPIVKNWDKQQEIAVDWKSLQMEYRDYLDISKLLQLLPIVGAVAGGAANHNLIKKLKVTAMNSYRMRVMAAGVNTMHL